MSYTRLPRKLIRNKRVPYYATGKNVFEAAEARYDFIYAEGFEPIICVSGGKDSTVVLELAVRAARRAGRLPVHAMFVDQECEWEAVADWMRATRQRDDVQFHWFQVPFKLSNGASQTGDHFFHCWDPAKEGEWMRPKEPGTYLAMTEEIAWNGDQFYGTGNLAARMIQEELGRRCVQVMGLRIDESPYRRIRLTSAQPGTGGPDAKPTAYKWITWYSRGFHRGKYEVFPSFSPIYDWRVEDVWKAIHEQDWRYNRLYDMMFQFGTNPRLMRVSSLSHEGAITKEWYKIHEFEPETWAGLQRRMRGANALRHVKVSDLVPHDLPDAFESWLEYRDYLLENLIDDDYDQQQFDKMFRSFDPRFAPEPHLWVRYIRRCIQDILKRNYFKGVSSAHKFWDAVGLTTQWSRDKEAQK